MGARELAESRIVIDADICQGKPRIKGTRVVVSDILLALAEGMDHTQILRNFRSIQVQDIKASIAYAFCLSENIQLILLSGFADPNAIEKVTVDADQNFSKALEEQAAIQEEITRDKVAEIKAKKAERTALPQASSKKDPPKDRPYDLLIDISAEALTKIFTDKDTLEQSLDMTMDNYIFETRKDLKHWLCYSSKSGVEIDPLMKRNLLVTYRALDGTISQAVFEGYLTTDRKHKVFIQRSPDGMTYGRAL